jgi:hypothetical protein
LVIDALKGSALDLQWRFCAKFERNKKKISDTKNWFVRYILYKVNGLDQLFQFSPPVYINEIAALIINNNQ